MKICIVTMFATFLFTASAAAQSFVFSVIPGQALGISRDGNVVVGQYSPILNSVPMIWTTTTGVIPVPMPTGAVAGSAWGASQNGSVIVGQVSGASSNYGFRWDINAGVGMEILQDLPGGSVYGTAVGVSSNGAVPVGLTYDARGAQAVGWVLDRGIWTPIILGSFGGNSSATSAASSIVGTSNGNAFQYRSGLGFSYLGDLPGGSVSSYAERISGNDAVIVGKSGSTKGDEACRWVNGGISGLGMLPGGSFSIATGVSFDGSTIVGRASSSLGFQAFIWRASTGMKNLNDVLRTEYAGTVTLNGWNLTDVVGLSDDGLTIVGSGTDPNRVNRSWQVKLNPLPAPKVSSVIFGDGTPQRSMVKRATIVFDRPITFNNQDSIKLTQRAIGGGVGNVIPVYPILAADKKTVVVSWGNTSLTDGNYLLTAVSSKIQANGQSLDGNGDGIAGDDYVIGNTSSNRIFRLFGDIDGDRSVSVIEFNQFRAAIGKSSGQDGYNSAFDFDGNGAITTADFNQFRSRYGTTLGF